MIVIIISVLFIVLSEIPIRVKILLSLRIKVLIVLQIEVLIYLIQIKNTKILL